METLEYVELIRGLHSLQARHHGCVATIGNFDGIHRGHQAIIARLKMEAQRLGIPSTLILFEPQPKEYFATINQEAAPIRLQRLTEKLRVLSKLNVDQVLCLPFTAEVRHFTREDFVQGLLVNQLGVRHLIVGDDFRFGHDRSGDFAYLDACAKAYGFGLEATKTLTWQGVRISSSAVREALSKGQLTSANALLGRTYSLSGKVIHGRKLGRTLGFPTANIHHQRARLPMTGVFLVDVVPVTGKASTFSNLPQPLSGVANLGYKPSIQGPLKASLEVHLLLPDGQFVDCYHHRLEVRFLKKIRDEQRFNSLEALQQQVQTDIAAARLAFQQHY
jgi:riboflavin kinase/FMN adenylyltransferase